jgi:hydrogenase maturation protein HypF
MHPVAEMDEFDCETEVKERRAITISGIVQGVGFRPYVYGLATRHDLCGFVRNRLGDVEVEVEGERRSLERFQVELFSRPPPLAQIDRVSSRPLEFIGGRGFQIEASESRPPGPVLISPDVATCADCLAELRTPDDRRFGYPFLNCTNCGPRLTIVTGAPYDRARTTMADFAMCPACRAEYDDPANRRFHAQPTACPECGPRLRLLDGMGNPIACDDPLASFSDAIRAGRIVAAKGLGGFHLVCDARNAAAVGELRRRKQRDEKPFAIMVRDLAAAEAICEVDPLERELLVSWRSPIVLLRKRNAAIVADAVAPGNPRLGVMLPYTPLHHLLLQRCDRVAEFARIPTRPAHRSEFLRIPLPSCGPLVMTSGNRTDEPIAYRDEDAIQRLCGIADLYLVHDRPIHVRCDDSVTRVVAGAESPLRRSRGYAPQPVKLPFRCPRPILAVGGQLKATFALGIGDQAILSHHLGDLDHYEAIRSFEKDVALYRQLFAVEPECIAHDAHPDYVTTTFAQSVCANACLFAVQHHHAHMAACMAEHGLAGPVIGVTFDGTGYGTDGAIWGGEFLVGDYRTFRRAAHLRYVGLPGGERAVKEPWRMAVAHLEDAGCDVTILGSRVSPVELRTVRSMLERQLNAPPTSSMGRLFDAVASLIGLRDRVSYEGQAAMELEWLAAEVAPQPAYPWELNGEVIDTRPLIRAVVEDVSRGTDRRLIARRFHATVADMIAGVCRRIRQETGLNAVVLSGGVFMNALLTEDTLRQLAEEQFDVYRHQQVPPNDGGLSLGQLAVAAAMLADDQREKSWRMLPASADAGSVRHGAIVPGLNS